MGPKNDQVSTERVPGHGRQQLEVRTYTLTVEEGPNRGAVARFEGRPLTIGKGRDCDLKLDDTTVSRVHAVIGPSPEGFTLEDQGSTNGTQVDGVRIKVSLLHDGCRIRLGKSVLLFSAGTWRLPHVEQSGSALDLLHGQSRAMKAVMEQILQVAPTQATIVLRGETGTGKEVAARVIHSRSERHQQPFVVFDCANVNRELLGSELFGHKKGAFTGAVEAHRGVFERAHGGTLLLDEIGELPAALQTRLLGVLQRREVQPIGSENAVPVDVRVLAATHRDLEALVESGGFRQDLYFRLAVFTIELPPLRERADDVPLLAEHFLRELRPGSEPHLSEEVRRHLQSLPWKGNVRELANAVQRALVLAGRGPIELAHFEASRTKLSQPVAVPSRPSGQRLDDAEKQLILEALQRNGWHRGRTARELGVSLSTIKRRVREFRQAGIAVPEDHDEGD